MLRVYFEQEEGANDGHGGCCPLNYYQIVTDIRAGDESLKTPGLAKVKGVHIVAYDRKSFLSYGKTKYKLKNNLEKDINLCLISQPSQAGTEGLL